MMLGKMVDSYLIYYLLGVLGIVGIASRVIRNIALKKLLVAAGSMAKSNHSFMRLVKAKYEHACMISDRVENTPIFVDKYVHEYKALGFTFYGWRRWEKLVLGCEVLLTILGIYGTYISHGLTTVGTGMMFRYGIMGISVCALLLLLRQFADEKYRINALKMYMVDYLENVYAHRFEKAYSKESKEVHPAEIQVPVAVQPQVVQASNMKGLKEAVSQEVSREETKQPEIAPIRPEPEVSDPGKNGPEIPTPSKTSTELPYTVPKEPLKEMTNAPREDVIREILAEFLA